jgi:hypothetical protein
VTPYLISKRSAAGPRRRPVVASGPAGRKVLAGELSAGTRTFDV